MPKTKTERPCGAPGCQAPALPRRKYCTSHETLYSLFASARRGLDKLRRQGDRGDMLKSLAAGAGYIAVDLVEQTVQSQVADGSWPDAWRKVREVVKTKPKTDPFAVLGLDPKTSTVDDVKKRQRKLASIFHSDKGADAAAGEKMKEVNAAATECVQILTKKS